MRPSSAHFGQEVRLIEMNRIAGRLSPFPRTGCFRQALSRVRYRESFMQLESEFEAWRSGGIRDDLVGTG
jgi:hypothetical protein